MNQQTDFTNTRAAVLQWASTEPERSAAMDRVKSNEDVDAWEAQCRDAERLVQQAFYEDTKHINNLDNCLRVHIVDLIRMSRTEPERQIFGLEEEFGRLAYALNKRPADMGVKSQMNQLAVQLEKLHAEHGDWITVPPHSMKVYLKKGTE